MTTYESIYNGADSLNPYGNVMYKAGDIGTFMDGRTANQLGEVNVRINPGVKTFEVQGVDAATWESVPEQHLDEIKRLSKLTGTKPTFHAPIVDASGMGKEGWSESNREGVEKQLQSAVLRSHKLDPDGNIIVTVHSTAQLPEMVPKMKGKEEPEAFYIIDPESGQIGPIKPTEKFFPEKGEEFTGKPKKFEPIKEVEKYNEDQWTENISKVNQMAAYGGEIMEKANRLVKEEFGEEKSVSDMPELKIDVERIKTGREKEIIKTIQRENTHGQIYLKDAYRGMKQLFDKAYKDAVDKNKEKDIKQLQEYGNFAASIIKEGIEEDPKKFEEVINKGLKLLGEKIEIPKTYIPLQDFIIEKSAQTFANVASSAYKEFKDKAPIISIENPPAGMGISKAEDIKELIEKSRDAMVKNLMKNQRLTENEAKQVSEKMIGATWDVGHINMLRRYGYEEKDIIEQTKTISPFVKHVHLSDNFGFEHTELPMGMGNVPIDKITKELDKKGFKGKKIIEAIGWVQHFTDKGGGHPFLPTLEGLDSPIYAMKEGPTWGQPTAANYSMGMGPINPQVHHSTYGAGLTNLPMELGGEIPGTQSRFAGTPNQ